MTFRTYSFLKDKQVISSDAYIIGSITDLNYAPHSWSVISLAVRGVKGLGEVLGSSVFRKPQFSLDVGAYEINDVLIIPENRDQLQRVLATEDGGPESVGGMIGKKVMTSDLIYIGTIADVGIEQEAWKINSFKVKIEKNVAEAIDIKLGLLNKTASGLLTSHIESVTDTVNLSRKVEDLRGYFTLD